MHPPNISCCDLGIFCWLPLTAASVMEAGEAGRRQRDPLPKVSQPNLLLLPAWRPAPAAPCCRLAEFQTGQHSGLSHGVGQMLMPRPHCRESEVQMHSRTENSCLGRGGHLQEECSSFVTPKKHPTTLALEVGGAGTEGDSGECTPSVFSRMWASPSHLGNCWKRQVSSPGSEPGARMGLGGDDFV